MAFRWRPRPPPPKPPKGKNVIPFPSDRVTPPGGTRLGDIIPDPPINLKEIRRQKEAEMKERHMQEGLYLPEGMTPSTKGLSELGEEIPVKDLPKESISSLEDQQLFILNRERMTSEQRAMRERDDKVILNDLATLDRKLLNKREKELRSNLDKLMGEDPRSDKKNSQGLPLTKTQIAVAKHFLDMIVAEIKRREEGLSGLGEKVPVKSDIEKYVDALNKQKRSERKKTPEQALGPIDEVGKSIKEFSGSMEKFGERNDPALDAISKAAKEIDKAGEASKKIIEISEARKGLSGLGEDIKEKGKSEGDWLDSVFGSITEQIKPKDVSKQKWITEIEDYGLDVEAIKSIVMYNIAKRWDKDTEPRALSKKEWIEELKDWEGMEDDPHEFLGPWFREWLESLQKE